MNDHPTERPILPNNLRIVAKRPALNFVNSVDPREGNAPIDYLRTYADLISWGVRAGVVRQQLAARLMSMSQQHPKQAEKALEHACMLREAIYRIFSSIAEHRPPANSDVALVREAFLGTLAEADLQQEGHTFRWREKEDLNLVTGIVARDAVALLESGLFERVKRCPGNGGCGWIFLDLSKNASRRWCSMAGCGNRVKARRHFRRVKAQSARATRTKRTRQ